MYMYNAFLFVCLFVLKQLIVHPDFVLCPISLNMDKSRFSLKH